MTLEKHLLEPIVYVFRRGVLVGMYLIYDHTFFCLNLVFGKGRTCGKFEQKGGRLRQVFLEHGRMEDDLLLGGERIQFASETVQISVDYGCASALGAFEYGVFDEVGDSGVESLLVARAASDAQCAICYGQSASLDCILQPCACLTAYHVIERVKFVSDRLSGILPQPSRKCGVSCNSRAYVPECQSASCSRMHRAEGRTEPRHNL